MPVTIERAAVVALGGADALTKRVTAFQAAVKAHAKTVNVPAPTEHPFVEEIVRRHGGAFDVLPPPPNDFVDVAEGFTPIPAHVIPPPEVLSLQQHRDNKLAHLAYARFARQYQGIRYGEHRIGADAEVLNSFVAAVIDADDDPSYSVRWKLDGGTFATFSLTDIKMIIRDIRGLTQRCFDREYEVTKRILAAPDVATLDAIDINAGWDGL